MMTRINNVAMRKSNDNIDHKMVQQLGLVLQIK